MEATMLMDARPMEMKKMTTATAINNPHPHAEQTSTTLQQSMRRWTAVLFVTSVLGAVAGLVGLMIGLLTILDLFVPTTTLYTASTLLIGASFILFGLAAHCLDKASAADKAIRVEYCRQHGLREDDCNEFENTK
jgi:hypothetical protein